MKLRIRHVIFFAIGRWSPICLSLATFAVRILLARLASECGGYFGALTNLGTFLCPLLASWPPETSSQYACDLNVNLMRADEKRAVDKVLVHGM